jgi:hypothetical protein
MDPFVRLRAPKIIDLKMDPFERRRKTPITLSLRWMDERSFLIVPAQAEVAAHGCAASANSRPARRPASFSVDVDQIHAALSPATQ